MARRSLKSERVSDHTGLFKQFSGNPNFKRGLTDMVFDAAYHPGRRRRVGRLRDDRDERGMGMEPNLAKTVAGYLKAARLDVPPGP